MTKTCSRCHFDNPNDALFCQKCGASIAPPTKNCACGAKNDVSAVFCKACGARFVPDALNPDQWHEKLKNKYWFYRKAWEKDGYGWGFYQSAFQLYSQQTRRFLNQQKYGVLVPVTSKDFCIQWINYLGKVCNNGLWCAMESKFVIADLSNQRIIEIPIQNLSRYHLKDWSMTLTLKDSTVMTFQIKKSVSVYANVIGVTSFLSSFSRETTSTDLYVDRLEADKARKEAEQSNELGGAFWNSICSYINEMWRFM